jgi:hypothetical protein
LWLNANDTIRRRSSKMPELNGVKCWLEDGDTQEPFQEYDTKVEGNTISTIITTDPGKPFTVSILQDEVWKPAALDFGPTRVTPLAFSEEINVSTPYVRLVGICTADDKVRIPFCFGVNDLKRIRKLKAIPLSSKRVQGTRPRV